MSKMMVYLVIWPNGHEEKIYTDNWKDFTERLEGMITLLGALPNLIYRKE